MTKIQILNIAKQFLSSKLGIDEAIAYTLSGRIIQAGGSIVSLLLIALFLTKEEQGFYYTFGSILAIQIFFELGFNGIITQYAAHETAHISTYDFAKNETEQKAQSRLSSLLRFCVRWFSILSIGLFIILLLVGYVFFTKYGNNENVNWKYPWLILVVNTSFSFVLYPLFSFLEGLGKIKEVAKLRLVQQLVNLIILWSMLSMGGRLYSAPVAGMCSLFAALTILLFSDFRVILIKVWNHKNIWKINYKNEIFPYQWKIAISWISGYFIFQLFNPVLFATDGAIVAGQMGMTLAALNGVSGLTMSWIITKVPIFSKLFAQSNYDIADKLFNKTYKQVLSINFVGVLTLFFIIFILRYYNNSLGERFLPLYLIAILGVSTFLNQMVFSWATYLRCHKKEPYLITSIVGALLIGTSTLTFGKLFGANGLIIGYVAIVVLMKFWEYKIFIQSKRMWHVITLNVQD